MRLMSVNQTFIDNHVFFIISFYLFKEQLLCIANKEAFHVSNLDSFQSRHTVVYEAPSPWLDVD